MQYTRSLNIFFALILTNVVIAQKVLTPTPPPVFEEEVFIRAEEMPRFPGCESVKDNDDERKKCSVEKLFQYIFTNLEYPEEAKKNGVQGTVVARFVITKDGKIGSVELLRDPGTGLGDAAKKVLLSMNTMPESWIPGRQRGNAVNVFYTLPIKFALEEGEKK
jgi:TonB family protein